MNVALYCRVSTEEQARKGLSLGDQLDALRHYAADHHHTIVGEFVDPGISARKRYTRRPALCELLRHLNDIDMVLFTKLDRWVRSVRDYYAVQDQLDAHHVAWQAILEDYETATASGRFKVNIMLSVAQDEADRTGERIKFTFAEMRARGKATNGRCPLGYQIVQGRPQLSEQSEAAAGMLAHYRATGSIPSTVRYLRNEHGIQRSYQVVQRALANPIYKGDYRGTECPALISPADWDLVQQLLNRHAPRAPSSGTIYLFPGILRCAECGRTLNAGRCVKSGIEYIYYRCPNQMSGGGCSHNRRVREDNLERYLLEHLLDAAQDYNLRIAAQPLPNFGKADRLKSKLEKLKDLYLSDLIDRDVYARDYAAIKAELDALAVPITAPKPVDLPALQSALDGYALLSREGKREFWLRSIRSVHATNSGDFFITVI